MEKQAHYLSPIKSSEKWQHMIFLDCQTRTEMIGKKGLKHVFCGAWGRYHNVSKGCDSWQWFTKCDEVWRWIEGHCRPKKKVVVLSHNLQRDLLVTQASPWFPKNGWTQMQRWFSPHGPQGFACFRKNGLSLWIICSANYFAVSLQELSALVGQEYEEIDNNTVCEETTMAVSKKRVDVVARVCLEFLTLMKEEDLGKPARTLAGWAFNAYRYKFLDQKILVHLHKGATALEIASYHGGRTECFNVGTYAGHFWQLDVRSMYPYLMRARPFPTILRHVWQSGLSPRKLTELVKRYYCIADVTITAEDAFYPFVTDGTQQPDTDDGRRDPLAHNDNPRARTCFPMGMFRSVLCGETLQRACEQGAIVAAHRVAVYEQADIFSGYVNAMWARRQAAIASGNLVYKQVWKMMLNTLHGKFGQRGQERLGEEPCDPALFEIEDIWYGETHEVIWRCFGLAQKFGMRRLPAWNSVIAIAAACADYGRNYLWSLMEWAGVENCFYADTDSLIVNEGGRVNLARFIGDELGQLNIDYQGVELQINAPKDYAIDDKVRRKGVRPGAIWDPFLGEWRQNHYQSLIGALRDGKSGYALEYEARIKPGKDIWGRRVNKDGSTEPWMIGPAPALKIDKKSSNKKANAA